MTALDIITLLLIGITGGLGFMKGFVTEALSLVSWVVALMAVRIFQPFLGAALTDTIGTKAGAAVLSFAIIFGVTFIGGRMLAKNMGSAARKSLLGPVDRVLGFAFGALKGLFGAVVLFLIVALVVDTYDGDRDSRPKWLTKSTTYPLLNASAGALVDVVKSRQSTRKAAHVADGDT
jgi:membrane protein required for colicin V production